MRRTVMLREPIGTPLSVYSPFGPVIAPMRVPVTVTCTSGKPLPIEASVTRPVTVPVGCCAVRDTGERIASAHRSATRRTKLNIIRGSPIRVIPVGATRSCWKKLPYVKDRYLLGQGQRLLQLRYENHRCGP